jgi:hypothetical protein
MGEMPSKNMPVQRLTVANLPLDLACSGIVIHIAGVILDAKLLARSQYSEGPATGHLDTGFSWFPCVYNQMVRWLPRFQVATICFSCSPPDLKLNVSVTSFIFLLHVQQPLPPGDSPIAVTEYYHYSGEILPAGKSQQKTPGGVILC